MKRKMNQFFKRIKKEWNALRKHPKEYWTMIFTCIREYIKNNSLFFVFVVVNTFNALLLRYFTIHTLENLLSFAPLLLDFAIVLLIGSFSYLLKPKNRFLYLSIVTVIMTAICIINASYYGFYNSFTSISFLSMTVYISDVGDAVTKQVIHPQDWIYLWAPLALIITYLRLRLTSKYHLEETREDKNKSKFTHTFAVALVSALVFCTSLTPAKCSRFGNQWNREYIVMSFGIYMYHINDLIKSIEPQITTLFGYDNAMKIFNDYYEKVPDTNTETNEYTNIFKGKNVIAIHAESMQTNNMTLSFNGEPLTPNLNKLASEGIFFDNFYSQVSVGTSSDTEFTYNTSLMPTNNGTAFVSYFNRTYVTIPKLLKEQGYYTFSMHANKANYWNRDLMHQSLGYDRFYSKDDYEIDEVIGLGLSDKSFFKQSVQKIKEINAEGKPYYGVVIMLTNHTPFDQVDLYGDYDVDIKEVVKDKKGNETLVRYPYMEGTLLGNYFKAVHYADEALGEFFASLEEEGLLDNTVIVLYGDHDARIGMEEYQRLYNYDKETDGILDPSDPAYKEFDYYQYELNRKVPLIIWSKETKENLHKTVSTAMGMIDVMPTLGNMFGFYNKYQLGHDIFNHLDDNIVAFPNGNWLSNRVYYNAQKNEYLPLTDSAISNNYIEKGTEHVDNLLQVSNSLIVFDLIQKVQELKESNSSYINERDVAK